VSEHPTIVEARESLHARLWAGECALDGDGKLAVAGDRLWRALCEQRFHAEKEGRRLSAHDLTEVLRRELFSTAELTVDADGFAAWISGVVPLTSPPSSLYMTAVEAVSFLAWGAFLTTDDIAAKEFAAPGDRTIAAVGSSVDPLWSNATWELIGKVGRSQVTLFGRKAPCFGGDPVGDLVPIPREFFAGKMHLGLFNGIYDRDHLDRAMYRELAVSTDEFSITFLALDKPAISTSKIARATTRQSTRSDEREFSIMARDLRKTRGFGPSIEEAVEFARERRLNRDWARKQHKGLPDELRRQRGGRGSTKHQLKARAAD
jgi:hypothetical protein